MVKTVLSPGDSPGLSEEDCAMGLCRLPFIMIAGSALAIAATAASASPPDGPPMSPPDHGPGMMHHGQGYTPSPEFRDSWLAECTDRLAEGRGRREARHAEERCVRYFDNYYDYYRMNQPAPGYAYGYQGAAMGYGGCCQQPAMMPAPRIARREPECTETVEYEYVDVPVRRRPPPPPAPAKRVKVVPDKRIKVK
jgi:hypothetical protein